MKGRLPKGLQLLWSNPMQWIKPFSIFDYMATPRVASVEHLRVYYECVCVYNVCVSTGKDRRVMKDDTQRRSHEETGSESTKREEWWWTTEEESKTTSDEDFIDQRIEGSLNFCHRELDHRTSIQRLSSWLSSLSSNNLSLCFSISFQSPWTSVTTVSTSEAFTEEDTMASRRDSFLVWLSKDLLEWCVRLPYNEMSSFFVITVLSLMGW